MHILDLAIEVTGVQEVRSPSGTARMILFDGHCSGDYFQGEIEPGGVIHAVLSSLTEVVHFQRAICSPARPARKTRADFHREQCTHGRRNASHHQN